MSGNTQDKTPEKRRASLSWAQRLMRVININPETCDQCGGVVGVIAWVIARIYFLAARSDLPAYQIMCVSDAMRIIHFRNDLLTSHLTHYGF